MTYPLDCRELIGRNVHDLGARWDMLSHIVPLIALPSKKFKQCFGVLGKNLGKLRIILGKLLDHRL